MTNKCCKYILNIPYPDVPLFRPDSNAVRLLLNDYSGPDGELSGVTQYLYNQLICAKQRQMEISEVFACVSMTEMHHLEILGKLILAYGGDPVFLYFPSGMHSVWWNGGLLSYNKSIYQMLKDAIESEKNAIKSYRESIQALANPSVSDVLERIIKDEEHHVELFEELLSKTPAPKNKA